MRCTGGNTRNSQRPRAYRWQPGQRPPDQIRFRNADIEEPLGKRLGKILGSRRVAHIAVDHDQIRIDAPEITQGFAKGIPGRLSHT